ncbi:MAG: TonB-dependent receptor [Bacteroidales bacterium]|nr:TonB-dependent receptor [Bacteroidales bacterium]
MKRLAAVIFVSFFCISLFSQNTSFITGKIIEAGSGQPLAGATVMLDSVRGDVSDMAGLYRFETTPGRHILDFNFLGFHTKHMVINVLPNDTVYMDINLETALQLLDEIVISAGKYEQKLSDVVVSMDIIKPDRIAETNTTSLESLVSKSPGIDVLDGQPRIRGGSGYSYGAGSRVLVLVDDLPILSPDAGDVKWDYLPVENVSRIEIIKGASSTLYGSSALNGVINLRTAYPGSKPSTKLMLFNGIYLNPQRKELIWWDNQQLFGGASFYHSRKAGNFDLVFGYNGFHDEGYRENEWEKRHRINQNLLYRFKKADGLSLGINSNIMVLDKIDFFLWQNADSGAYRQNNTAVFALKGLRLNVDPYVEYFNDKGSKHTLKTRYFKVINQYEEAPDKDNEAGLYYGEYKYHKSFKWQIDLTAGTSFSYANIHSNLFKDHSSLNSSIYAQLDGNIQKKLRISLGTRYEIYRLDEYTENSKPVFRAGINYHLTHYTFLRASFGQGYRFPSIAEKYTATSLSSVNIFPNPELNSESGWTAEFGIKQGLLVRNLSGFLDVSFFCSRYKDMIEYTFGIYKPDSIVNPTFEHVGFKALNVGNAQITGVEISLTGEGKILGLPFAVQAGYTYIYPIDMDYNSSDTSNLLDNNILKYRYQHSVKVDAELGWKKLTTGFSFVYNSFMKNVDPVFTDPVIGNLILPGYPEYRINHQKGYVVIDHRISYNLTGNSRIAIITKNILNEEYIGRPGDIGPPRNITIQLSVNF